MARRRNEDGLKRQHRIESERQRREAPGTHPVPDERPDQEHQAPVPPSATQPFENLAPPITAPQRED